MTKASTFFIILMFISLKSQTHRFIYEYRFIPDSTKSDSIITDEVRLEIFKDHSEFVSDLTAKRDSAIRISSEKNTGEIGTNLKGGQLSTKVWKDKEKMYSVEYIGVDIYKVNNDQQLNWTLSNETKIIQNYNCQKATMTYGKRNWIAWFTNDIPIQDGPYIFSNLPGLIIELQDSNQAHSFQLISNFKTNNRTSNITNKYITPIETTREKFNKKWNEFRKNPIGWQEQFAIQNPQNTNFRYFDANGKELNTQEFYKEGRNKAEKEIRKRNNFLDLELYQ